MSWYQTGFDATTETAAKEAQKKESRYGPPRFWMPADTEREIVFVDDDPVGVFEHNPKLNGSFRNWLTCDNEDCCEILGADTRYYVGFLTIVDLGEWTDKQGKVHKNDLYLYPAKTKTLKKLKRKNEKSGSIAMNLVEVAREDRKSPNVGDSFDFGRDVDAEKMFYAVCYKGRKLSEMFDEAEANPEKMVQLKNLLAVEFDDDGKLVRRVVPFNYHEVLKPMGGEAVRAFLGEGPETDRGSKTPESPSDLGEDDIPF